MEISVIIPTYKPQSYLWECLQSIVNQTFDKALYEIIIVLNGCNDPYYSEIQSYIQNHMLSYQVQLIQTDMGGVSNARNIGLAHAKGAYVCFIDDDDYISSTYLEELHKKADKHSIVLTYPYAFHDGNAKTQLPYRITEAYDYCTKHHCYTLQSKARKFFAGPCMKLIPMEVINGRQFDVRLKIGEDSLFMFLVSNKVRHIQFTSKNAVYYRRYRANSAILSSTFAQRLVNAFLLIQSYSSIYFSNIQEYSFNFYFTRILGSIRSIIQR